VKRLGCLKARLVRSELIVSTEASAIAVSQVFLNTNMEADGGFFSSIIIRIFLT
jgi:hypothetical protein